jgi:hypothetical protein
MMACSSWSFALLPLFMFMLDGETEAVRTESSSLLLLPEGDVEDSRWWREDEGGEEESEGVGEEGEVGADMDRRRCCFWL